MTNTLKTNFAGNLYCYSDKSKPIQAGDVLVTEGHRRLLVEQVDDNIHGPVYVCLVLKCPKDAQAPGRTQIIYPREIAYRSVAR